MGEIIQYSDFFKPGTEQDFRSYLKSLGDIAKQETSKIIADIQSMSKNVTNEISAKNIKSQNELSTAIDNGKKKISEINAIEKERVRIVNEYEKLTAKLATATSKESVENEKLKVSLTKVNTERKREAKITLEAQGSYKRMALELSKNIDKYKSLSSAQRENAAIGGKLLSTIQGHQISLKKMDGEMGNFQRNVGNYNGVVDKAKGLMLGWFAAIGGVMGALRGAKAVIDSTDTSADSFAVTVGGMTAAWQLFKKSMTSMDFSNFFTNMREAINAGREYTAVLDAIGDRQRANKLLNADELKQSKELELIWRDRRIEEDRRKLALTQWQSIQENAANREAKTATDSYNNFVNITSSLNQINKESLEESLKMFNAYEDEYKKLNDSGVFSTFRSLSQTIGEENAINANLFFDKVSGQYKKLTDTQKQLILLTKDLGNVSEDERDKLVELYVAMRTAEAAVLDGKLTSLRAEVQIDKATDKTNKTIKEQIVLQGTINKLKQRQSEIEKEIPSLDLTTAAGIGRLSDLQIESDRIKTLIGQYENMGKLIPLIGKKGMVTSTLDLKVPVNVEIEPVESTEAIFKKFANSLGLSEDEFMDLANKLSNSLSDLFSSWNNLIIIQAENELNQHERVLEGLKSRLDDERKLKEDGKANDYDMLVSQISDEQKLRDKSLAEYEKAQKKQVYIDGLSQVSQLTLAATEILGQNAKTGPYGILVGFALVASMIATFLSMKAKISAISNNNKYAEGTEYLERGNRPKGKDTIPIWANEGERIVPDDINAKLDGIDNDKLPGIYQFYKQYHMRGAGAMQIDNYAVVRELKKGRMVNEKMYDHMKHQSEFFQLSDGRILRVKGPHNTEIIALK